MGNQPKRSSLPICGRKIILPLWTGWLDALWVCADGFAPWLVHTQKDGRARRSKDSAYCRWINELAVGLGLLGTIRGFIVVASQQGGVVGSGPNETLCRDTGGNGFHLYWHCPRPVGTAPAKPGGVMKKQKKGVMFAAMTDLFMNFALALGGYCL